MEQLEQLEADIFTLDELFDDLISQAAEQPDDSIVMAGIRQLITNAHETGDIEFTMRSAMILGAMACMDDHFAPLAAEAGERADSLYSHDSNHGHQHMHETNTATAQRKHDAKKCRACKAGKYCKNKGTLY